jgi:hypothetical protein
MLITFQINREASLGLAHRKTLNFTKGRGLEGFLQLTRSGQAWDPANSSFSVLS